MTSSCDAKSGLVSWINLIVTWAMMQYMASLLVNSLWPGIFKWNFRWVLFKPITVIGGWDTSCEIALRRMSLDLTNHKSRLVQVMAWCRQATRHYLGQCWPSFLSPCGFTGPQYVNTSLEHTLDNITWTINALTDITYVTFSWEQPRYTTLLWYLSSKLVSSLHLITP